jgi:hypothetical protein
MLVVARVGIKQIDSLFGQPALRYSHGNYIKEGNFKLVLTSVCISRRGLCKMLYKKDIKMDLLEIGVSVVDWIGLAQDRYRWRALVNSVMNLWVP